MAILTDNKLVRLVSHNFMQRLLFAILLFGFATCSGIVGFMVLEGYTLNEAFYMTIITISTVGFSGSSSGHIICANSETTNCFKKLGETDWLCQFSNSGGRGRLGLISQNVPYCSIGFTSHISLPVFFMNSAVMIGQGSILSTLTKRLPTNS